MLDVATGSGNAAIAAARRGCEVVGIDFVPALLERGRIRAASEHLDVEFLEGDAEDLPFPDASFDAVISVYGVMFAPDHHRAAAELARVCRPGGLIALASWTPDGFIGETFRVFSRHLPPAPGLQPPVRWGDQGYLDSLFGDVAASMASHRRTAVFRFGSAGKRRLLPHLLRPDAPCLRNLWTHHGASRCVTTCSPWLAATTATAAKVRSRSPAIISKP